MATITKKYWAGEINGEKVMPCIEKRRIEITPDILAKFDKKETLTV